MANTLRFKRGLVSGIPNGALGEPLFTTDTFDLYIGNGTTNTRFQKYIASGTTSQLLRGDGSLLTMPIVLTSPSSGQVLKFNGTNWVNDSDAGVTGSGTTNYLPKFTGASTLGNSLVFDNGSFVGINTVSSIPANANASIFFGSTDSGIIYLTRTTGADQLRFYTGGNRLGYINTASSILTLGTANYQLVFSTNDTHRARITAGGNFIINNASTDNGLRFQVTGDGYFSGSVGIGSSSLTGVSLMISKAITGGTVAYGIRQDGTVQSDVTNTGYGFRNVLNTAASASFGDYFHFRISQGTIGAGATFTNQFGYFADPLTGATNNYGFYGNIASGTGRWNLYMNGTANNYMAGSLGIGSTSLANYTIRSQKTMTGAVAAYGVMMGGQIQSDVTTVASYYRTAASTQSTSFTLIDLHHFFADGVTIGAGSAVTNQYGFLVNSNLTSATNNYGFYGNIASGTGRWNLYMNGTANNYMAGSLGINSTVLTGYSLRVDKNLTGATTAFGVYSGGQINSDVTGTAFLFRTRAFTQAASFTLSSLIHYSASNSGLGAGSAITNQYGFIAEADLTQATNNYGFYGNITAATGRWNFYANGSAANYFNGNTIIGTLAADSGEKLQVNGTMRVSGASTVRAANIQNTTDNYLVVTTTNAGGDVFTVYENSGDANNAWAVGRNNAGNFVINHSTAATIPNGTYSNRLLIDSTGAATFSSSVTAGSFIPTSSTIPTNGMYLSAANTLAFATASGNKLTISSTGLATFSDSARFSNQKGCIFVQTGGSLLGSISMDSGNAITIDNNGFFGLSVGTNYTMTGGNLGIGHNSFGTSATKTISVNNGTAPSSSPVDSFQMYSNDVVAGNAAPHFRTENGAVIKLYQQDNSIAAANFVAGIGTSVTTLDAFDGYTIGQVVKALRNAGILL